MATFQVLIGGVDRTSVIAVETFTAEIGSRENITTCSFDIRDETRSIEVKGAESVVVKQDTTTIWSGYVGNVSVSFDGNANMLAVDAQSGNNMLDQKAYRTIGYVSKGTAGSANDKGSIRPSGFSRTFGAEVVWLLASSTCSPGASPITYSSAKIYKATNSLTARVDYGGKTLREGLEDFIKAAYGAKKMTFWVDAAGALNIQPTGQSANMLENFDFYNGATSDWTLAGGASITAAAGQSTGAPGAGSVVDYGVQLDDNTESAVQNAAVVAGRRYYVAGGLKNQTSNRGRINLVWRNSGGTTISTDSLSTATVGSWVRLEGIYTAPATATSVNYTLSYFGSTSGAAYFDNLRIIEENAGFGISDTPNNTSTFAPEDYEESVDSSAVINAVAIKGKKYTVGKTYLSDGHDAWQTYYVEYAPSIAYFGKVFTTALDDDKVSSAAKATEAAYKIFSESAFPIREGTYKISSAKLGAIVPTPGTYQIFQMSRMPSARQVTINRIESVSVLPYGAGEVVYEVQFGAQKGNIASALATVGSAMWGTGKPKTGSTVFEHNFVRDGLLTGGRTLTDPQTTGVAAEVEQGAAVSAIAPMSVVKKNTALTPANNLPNLADYGGDGEFPIGSLILLVPDAGDPHLTKPTLYRSDGTTTWTAVTPAQLKSDAVAAGRMSNGMIVADSIFAGTIDAGTIDVTNLNASNITTGTLTSIAINAGSGKFTVDSSGNALANSITLGSTATVTNTAGNEVTGSIYSRPGDNVTSAQFRLVADDSNNLTRSITGITSSGAAANANCTINATAHPFSAGQFVWFTGATGAGAAALNAITESLPAQIISTTTNAFVINYYLAIGAITAGTATAGKRLSVVAPSGLFVYQSDSKPGAIATGSIALGTALTKLGKGSTATLADGEIGFLTSTTPRYAGGGNLFSPDGTATVATSGDFRLGVSSTSTQGDIEFKAGTGGRIGAFSATAGNTSIGVFNSDRSGYTALVANGFYPAQGSSYLGWSGTQFTMNDSVAVTGAITATTSITATGNIDGANQASYVRADISTSSTTSIPAGGFQSHSLTWTATGASTPYVVASPYMTTGSTVSMSAVVFSQVPGGATVYLYNTSSLATTVSRRAQGIAVVP
jgi:hypothetical protein